MDDNGSGREGKIGGAEGWDEGVGMDRHTTKSERSGREKEGGVIEMRGKQGNREGGKVVRII